MLLKLMTNSLKTKHFFFFLLKNKYNIFFIFYFFHLRLFLLLNAKDYFFNLPFRSINCKFKFVLKSQSKWIFVLTCYFLYSKIIAIVPLKKFSFFFLPIKQQLFTLTRAPFVFKKVKEQFILETFKAIIHFDLFKINLLSVYYFKKLINFIEIYIPFRWSLYLKA